MQGVEEGQKVRSPGWAQGTSEATSQEGRPVNWLPEHNVANMPCPPRGCALPGFHTEKISMCLSSQQRPLTGMYMMWNKSFLGVSSVFNAACYSGWVMMWKNHLT